MTALEHELAALAGDAFPSTPDIAGVVRVRIDRKTTPSRSRVTRRRAVALAFAVIAVAVGAAFAVPQARSEILDWLGFGSVRIEFVDELPVVSPVGVLQLGERVTMSEARARMPFGVPVPSRSLLGDPDGVYVWTSPAREVTLLYGSTERVRALYSVLPGRLDFRFVGKLLGPGARLERTTVAGQPARWIDGAPHVFYYRAPNGSVVDGTIRRAGNTLLWQRGGRVLRLEGAFSRQQAVRIAMSVS
jgi:hypothetical protein